MASLEDEDEATDEVQLASALTFSPEVQEAIEQVLLITQEV